MTERERLEQSITVSFGSLGIGVVAPTYRG